MQPITINLKSLLAELEDAQSEQFTDNYLKECSPISQHHSDDSIQDAINDVKMLENIGKKRTKNTNAKSTQFKITNSGAKAIDINAKEDNYTVIYLPRTKERQSLQSGDNSERLLSHSHLILRARRRISHPSIRCSSA
jgi:hypothetical protein